MLSLLQEFDVKWFLRVNGNHGAWSDQFMLIASYKHSWIIYLPFLFFLYKKTHFAFVGKSLAGVLITFALTDLVAAKLLKPLVGRPRPCHVPEIQELIHLVDGCGGPYGFVSNHAANHFGLAIFFGYILSPYIKGITKWFLLFAFIVGYSRVYLGVHYPGDIFGGALLGILISLSVLFFFKRLVKLPS